MDEAVLGHYEAGKSPQLALNVDIDASNPKSIQLTITDNGRGFPPAFLAKNSTLSGKQAYIMEAGSIKEPSHSKADISTVLSRDTKPPALFGGAGLGLRILIAGVLYGDMLTGPGRLKPKYERPAISEITLSNRTDSSGAMIQVTTSRIPLKEKKDDLSNAAGHCDTESTSMPLKMNLPIKKAKKTTGTTTTSPAAETVGSTHADASPRSKHNIEEMNTTDDLKTITRKFKQSVTRTPEDSEDDRPDSSFRVM